MKNGIRYIVGFKTSGDLIGIFKGYTEAARATSLQASYVHKIVHGKNQVNQCNGMTFVGVDRYPTERNIKSMSNKVFLFFIAKNTSIKHWIRDVAIIGGPQPERGVCHDYIDHQGWVIDDNYHEFTKEHNTWVYSKNVRYRGEEKKALMLYNKRSMWLLLSIVGIDGITYCAEQSQPLGVPIVKITASGTVFAGKVENCSQLEMALEMTGLSQQKTH